MISKFSLKPAAILTLFFFVWLCLSSSLTIANENKHLSSDRKNQDGSSSIVNSEASPGMAEVAASTSRGAVLKSKKKLPWLLIGVGAVAVVALIVLLAKKKTVTKTNSYSNGILTFNGVRYDMLSIPAGEFQMGSNSSEAYPDQKPVHTVQISRSFWLGKTEVTQGLWQAVMGSNPSSFKKGDTYPVDTVSWDDCQAFIQKLNQLVGGNPFRLPTEAEWEYACRAGTTGDYYGPIDAISWYESNSGGSSHPVGQKQANAFGFYDMAGNVWEWCQDWFGAYSSANQTDPTGPATGTDRVGRGGSWGRSARLGGSAYRDFDIPGSSYYYFGFRLAASSNGG